MGLVRILVWAANLGGGALLWSAIAGAPLTRHQQLALGTVTSVMALTLAYVWVLEAAQRRQRRPD